MSPVEVMEARLAAVEKAVAELQRRLPPAKGAWWERVVGSFKDAPAFEEVLRYGRAIREADRPVEDDPA